ncbi:MAG TPA: YcxB family protein [Candidatus Solibacter sp.]|jgi:hypothetical protein|nr:YcxB family protein [Candidatus Solibacter sp.]
MIVTYSLSWEEYAEQYQYSWPKPDYFSAIVTMMIALPLIAYGVALARFLGPSEKMVSTIFIGAPLFLVVFVVLALTLEAGKARTHEMVEKRLEYERFHAKEQSFSADQEKWTHESQAGKQEIRWTALAYAVELQHGFLLAGEKSSCLVPKRILDDTTLSMLRQSALPTGDSGWTFKVLWRDYFATGTALLWHKYWLRMAFGNAIGFVVLLWIAYSLFSSNEKSLAIWGWILAASAVVFTLAAQLWYLPLRFVTSDKSLRAPMKVETSGQGVRFTTSRAEFFMAWTRFREFQETGGAFLLYRDASNYYLLPKSGISPEQRDQLRRILREKLKRVITRSSDLGRAHWIGV